MHGQSTYTETLNQDGADAWSDELLRRVRTDRAGMRRARLYYRTVVGVFERAWSDAFAAGDFDRLTYISDQLGVELRRYSDQLGGLPTPPAVLRGRK
jgi:hypothetical protein